MEKINLSELADLRDNNVIHWALCELMGQVLQSNLPFPFKGVENSNVFEVETKIDGVEVKFSHILKQLIEQYDKQVENKAKEMLREKFVMINSRLNEMEESLNRGWE